MLAVTISVWRIFTRATIPFQNWRATNPRNGSVLKLRTSGRPTQELAGGLHTLACGSVTSLRQRHVGDNPRTGRQPKNQGDRQPLNRRAITQEPGENRYPRRKPLSRATNPRTGGREPENQATSLRTGETLDNAMCSRRYVSSYVVVVCVRMCGCVHMCAFRLHMTMLGILSRQRCLYISFMSSDFHIPVMLCFQSGAIHLHCYSSCITCK